MTQRFSESAFPQAAPGRRPAGAGMPGNRRPARPGFRVRVQPVKAPLYWTDAVMLGALMLALAFVIDPFLHLERIALTKHLPLVIGCFALTMTLVGASLSPGRDRTRRASGVAQAAMPFLLLATWIIAGSLYARFADHINDTFLTVGLYMLVLPGIAVFIAASPARWRVVGVYMRALSVAAAFMILVMIAEHVTSGGAYHELEYLVVPVGVFYAMRPRGGRLNICLAAFFLLGGLTFLKLTGFMALGIALAYLWIVDWRFRFRDDMKFRFWAICCVSAAVLLGAGIAAAIMSRPDKVVPDGNPGYRLVTYQNAIHRFLDSPIYGTSFDAPATSRFTAFDISAAHGELATHSDLLDLAANGGLLALGLLLWANVRVLRYARQTLFAGGVTDDMVAAAHALACMTLTGALVYAFNPILLQPDRALLLWCNTGLLLGMALCHRQGRSLSNSER
jgi:hypothetical protein